MDILWLMATLAFFGGSALMIRWLARLQAEE